MALLSTVMVWLAQFATNTISTLGYGGIVTLMALESMVFPLPSELVMPFAGFLASQGRFSFALVIVASAVGSFLGSLLSYAIGRYGGTPFFHRYGKWFLLDEEDLLWTQQWFAKRGELTVFISRFIPVVRHVISIPAGISKMNPWKFSSYTVLGATPWNAVLAYLGYVLGKNWESVRQSTEWISVVVTILLVGACAWFVWKHVRRKTRAHVHKV